MKQWRSKAEAEALDCIITLVFQYMGSGDDDIETYSVRSVEAVIDLLEEYGLVHEVKVQVSRIPLIRSARKRVNMDRWRNLTDYIRSAQAA